MGKWLAMLEPENLVESLPVEVSKVFKVTYHGFTLAELEAEAADDWQEIQNDPGQLEAFAHALKTTRTRQQGERPDYYTKAAECAVCGPVWLWEGAPDNVQGCPWCINSGPVPRPGPVLCRDCNHWIADTINPVGGLGQCGQDIPGMAWPWRDLECSQYRASLLPSVT